MCPKILISVPYVLEDYLQYVFFVTSSIRWSVVKWWRWHRLIFWFVDVLWKLKHMYWVVSHCQRDPRSSLGCYAGEQNSERCSVFKGVVAENLLQKHNNAMTKRSLQDCFKEIFKNVPHFHYYWRWHRVMTKSWSVATTDKHFLSKQRCDVEEEHQVLGEKIQQKLACRMQMGNPLQLIQRLLAKMLMASPSKNNGAMQAWWECFSICLALPLLSTRQLDSSLMQRTLT